MKADEPMKHSRLPKEAGRSKQNKRDRAAGRSAKRGWESAE